MVCNPEIRCILSTPLKQPKTEREQKVKRKLALGQLVHNRRNHQKGILSKNVDAADSSTKESELSHSDYRSSGNESDLDGCVVEHSQSQDLMLGEDYHSSGYGLWDVVDGQKKINSDSRSSGDESDLDEFVVEDSQSQDLPTREELFVRYLEVILNSIVDEEFSSSLQNSNALSSVLAAFSFGVTALQCPSPTNWPLEDLEIPLSHFTWPVQGTNNDTLRYATKPRFYAEEEYHREEQGSRIPTHVFSTSKGTITAFEIKTPGSAQGS
ncbi:hypothetical protein pdam_00024948 [Pocillopora damicornis]|uniref:Uncharacterized protein n=1 Tax=Pocillopora damicornis TaxID=46731 RepID=A0A3M6TM87_POCDA|nr:hypothetical protein pdam_00024948 [Pocillopora damicornis]